MAFISLDGIDGTGKSTQCRLLADWLRSLGRTVVECRDPGGTPIGDRLRSMLLTEHQDTHPRTEALLFMAARSELVSRVIRPALAAGHIVVSDRFLLANVVYQGHGGGLSPSALWEIGRFATQHLEPDLTILLDMPVADAMQRRGRSPDVVESRGIDFHERVRNGFLFEAGQRPDRVAVIDARPDLESVRASIQEAVERSGLHLEQKST
jgi:dTMP kinase